MIALRNKIIQKLRSTNKLFVIIGIVFIVLVTFVDKNNLLDSWQVKGKINDLEKQKEYYLEKIKEDSTIIEKLEDPKFLEKFARENYYMKKENEVIYIVK